MRIARGSSGSTSTAGTRSRRRPIEPYGPIVCEGVRPSGSVIVRPLGRRRLAPAEHDVPAEPERPVGLRELHVERADEPGARAASSRTELKMGSNGKSGSSGKYICVTSRSVNARPKSEKWMCAGRHAFGWFPHG